MKQQKLFIKTFSLLLLLALSLQGWGQQVIGSYPDMNGGFEAIGLIENSVFSSAQAGKWVKNNSSTTIAEESTVVRSGSKSLLITNNTTTGRRVWSPLISVSSTTSNVTIQFFRRVGNTTDTQQSQAGIGNGTTTGEATSSTYGTPLAANTWEKFTYTRNSWTFTDIAGVIFTRQTGTGGNLYIDDFVVYNGAVDNTAPNAPGTVSVNNATASSLDVSWLAASGGVDGGGYVVVRYSANPNADNDPNQNGIYAVGNTITNGTGALVGTVRYIGTGLSFTDNVGLTEGTQYWYKVYTVDKAFNYSEENIGNGTTTGVATPNLLVSTNSLINFTYVLGSGPSAEQTFTVSGVSLSNNITINAPTNYEISETTGSGYTNQIVLQQTGGSVNTTTIYVRLKIGLNTNTYNENITLNSGVLTETVSLSGGVTAPPPTITVSTNDLTGFTYLHGFGPSAEQNFEVSGTNLTADVVITAPSNYEISTGTGVSFVPTSPINLAHTSGTLAATTIYVRLKANLAVGTYNESINLTSTNATTKTVNVSGSVTSEPIIYSWNGGTNGDWTTSTNWLPTRNTPESTDIMQFNDGATIIVSNVPTQTIGKLLVNNNTDITLQSSAAITFTIAGGLGTDFVLESGSALNIAGSNNIQISLNSGAIASVSGLITFTGGAHRLLSADASGVVFNSGSKFVAGTGFSGNPFGTNSLNSIIFSSGSIYEHIAGSNPFGASQPNSVVQFQTGSLFIQKAGTPAFSGRTYSNFELDITGSATPSGTASVSIDNLTVTNGTLNFNMTGTPGHAIKGNISVASGATLNFAPTSAGTVNLNGLSKQIITNNGTITAGTNSTLIFSNDVDVIGNITVNNLVNNAILTLKSDASGTATLIDNGISGSGTFKVEQYLTGTGGLNTPTGRGWYVASPVVGATSATFIPGSTNKIWSHSEVDQVNTASGYTEITNNTTLLTPGSGYVVRLGVNETVSFEGTAFNTGVLNYTGLTRTGTTDAKRGFHLMGNPYPSYLDWDQATKTNVDVSIWYRTTNSSGTMVFDTYNASNGFGTNNNESGAVTKFIPPMQGFWIKVTTDGQTGTLGFSNAMRSHQSGNLLKTTNQSEVLRLKLGNGINSDEAIILFNQSAGTGLTSWDSEKMMNSSASVPQIYSKEGSTNLVINSLPEITNGLTVPLFINLGEAGQYSINTDLTGLDPFTVVTLQDLQLGIFHDLSNGVYNFTSTVVNNSNRFVLHFNTVLTDGNLTTTNTSIYAADNKLHINSASAGVVEVYDLLGKRLVKTELNSGMNVITLNSKGVYLVKVSNSKEVITEKVSLW